MKDKIYNFLVRIETFGWVFMMKSLDKFNFALHWERNRPFRLVILFGRYLFAKGLRRFIWVFTGIPWFLFFGGRHL